jgi:hypothetical protein
MSEASTPPLQGYPPALKPDNSTIQADGSWASVEPPSGNAPAYRADFYVPYSRTTYQPTLEQLERDEARRRYLRRNVYLPLAAAVAIVVLLFAIVLLLAFGVGTPQALSFIAGLSGLTIILMSIPMILIMSVLPIVYVAYVLNRRQQRRLHPETGPMAYRSRLQILLWRIDGLFDQVQPAVQRGSMGVRRPLVAAHTFAASLKGWVDAIIGESSRS